MVRSKSSTSLALFASQPISLEKIGTFQLLTKEWLLLCAMQAPTVNPWALSTTWSLPALSTGWKETSYFRWERTPVSMSTWQFTTTNQRVWTSEQFQSWLATFKRKRKKNFRLNLFSMVSVRMSEVTSSGRCSVIQVPVGKTGLSGNLFGLEWEMSQVINYWTLVNFMRRGYQGSLQWRGTLEILMDTTHHCHSKPTSAILL